MSNNEEEDLTLRAQSQETSGINKSRVFIVINLVLAIGLLIFVFSSPGDGENKQTAKKEPVQYDQPIRLEGVPSDYSDVKNKGNLVVTRNGSITYTKAPQVKKTEKEDGLSKEELAARKSPLAVKFSPPSPPQNGKKSGGVQELSTKLEGLSKGLNALPPPPGQNHVDGVFPDPQRDPNRQFRKLTFVNKKADNATTNPHTFKHIPSPYAVMASTVISASLITGLNSDLPGQVTAQVTRSVYDTATGKHLLIPQGSRLIGQYDSLIAPGQVRALLTWSRIILPNGSSISIDNLPASDAAGYSGLRGSVDNHTWELIKGVALATILNIGSNISIGGDDDDDTLASIRDSVSGNVTRASDRIVNQKLDRQPTLKVKQGAPLAIIVQKDLIMEPYRVK